MEIKISSSSQFTPRFPLRFRRRTPLFIPIPSRRILSAKTSDPSIPSFPLSIHSIPDWADAIQERGVQKRRSLYTPEDWRAHRSSFRHLRHLLSSLSSRVILSLVPPVSVFTCFAAALAVYNSAVSHRWLPELFPLLHASSLPYQLTAPALALLLVFRTEASYSRFVEGRKVWMSVVAGASEMAGIVISSMARGRSGADEAGIKRAILNYIMAFPVALKESKISCFYEGISVCEQIIGIPIPLSYTRLTSRFLVFWHFSLPVVLWDDCNWIVVPATFISAASLFCIEEVGVLIEEPFPMLALDELCKKLNDSIQEAIEMERSVYTRLTAKLKGRHGAHSINGRLNS